MWYMILSVVVIGAWLAFTIHKARNCKSHWREEWYSLGVGLGTFGVAIALLALSAFTIPATTGLMPEYSNGSIVGCITEVRHEGIIWKTWEVRIALNAGEPIAYQPPTQLSVPDAILAQRFHDCIGQRVRLAYKGWLLMPFRLGATNYEVTAAEWLD